MQESKSGYTRGQESNLDKVQSTGEHRIVQDRREEDTQLEHMRGDEITVRNIRVYESKFYRVHEIIGKFKI